MISIVVNGTLHQLDVPDETPLLWVLRDHLGLMGTKYGCDSGVCGVCTVLVNGNTAAKSCQLTAAAPGGAITTIEGLSPQGTHPLQQAWITEQVPQCGYCTSGQIMAAAALLAHNPKPSDSDINQALTEVLCRCGTYPRIRRAVHRAAATPPSALPAAVSEANVAVPAKQAPSEASKTKPSATRKSEGSKSKADTKDELRKNAKARDKTGAGTARNSEGKSGRERKEKESTVKAEKAQSPTSSKKP